jgi:hypothetical protein
MVCFECKAQNGLDVELCSTLRSECSLVNFSQLRSNLDVRFEPSENTFQELSNEYSSASTTFRSEELWSKQTGVVLLSA